ncbi:phage tail assembly chaperone [Sphingomonas montana]|uniref:phage tail assembly chaperone n=1 Tax=Sphingomonas montana TaxID=1843236 RepID=UPI0009FAE417
MADPEVLRVGRAPPALPRKGRGEDGARFAEAAVRMAGQAGVLFGWGPERFWRATPAELAALAAVVAGDVDVPLGAGELDAMRERDPDG